MKALVLLSCLLLVGCGGSAQDSATPETSSAPADISSSAPADTASVSSAWPAVSPTPPPDTGGSSIPSPSSRRPGGTTIVAADSQFGSILYDASGQAIYLFDAERSTRPACYGDCADAWPPVLTRGKPRASPPVQSDLLGTTRRTDGAVQVTYAGHPLYFYAHEGKYQVLCHNIEGFGGTWLAVQPRGDPAPR